MVMVGLSTSGPHSLTIEWDTTKGGKHALDYIGTFNETVTTANPCLGVTGCTFPGVANTNYTEFAIPTDPQVDNGSGSPIAQLPGNFRLYGGTITGVTCGTGGRSGSCSGRTLISTRTGLASQATSLASITIQFTASVANPVMAWSGHIASRHDWGTGNSAVDIDGSPFPHAAHRSRRIGWKPGPLALE